MIEHFQYFLAFFRYTLCNNALKLFVMQPIPVMIPIYGDKIWVSLLIFQKDIFLGHIVLYKKILKENSS